MAPAHGLTGLPEGVGCPATQGATLRQRKTDAAADARGGGKKIRLERPTAAEQRGAVAGYEGQFKRRPQPNTAAEDRILFVVIFFAVFAVLARFVYLFHDRMRIAMGGEDTGGSGCYQMMGHSCSFETEVCCPDGCAAAGGLWVDGEERRCRTGSCAVLDCGRAAAAALGQQEL